MRAELLAESDREQFCILLGKRQDFGGGFCINVVEMLSPGPAGYVSNSLGHVSPRKEFVLYALSELQERWDVDTLIDVHTHPFCSGSVSFSGVDDADEVSFFNFLRGNFDDIHYASIVLSQQQYEARVWFEEKGNVRNTALELKTPTATEMIPASNLYKQDVSLEVSSAAFLDRTVLALGHRALQAIVGASQVVVVGVGGLGSVVAENLVHMGFRRIVLVDHDIVEESNLNRIVGAYWDDAVRGLPKVDAVARHLANIRPDAGIITRRDRIEALADDPVISRADWIVIATDNHGSRLKAQELAFRYYIPFVSAGVSISVDDGRISDYSGEVILIRPGDRFCLLCLGRLNLTKIAAERAEAKSRSEVASTGDVEPDLSRLKGYVDGALIHQPAVKTLNSIVGAMAVDQIVNQYTARVPHEPILVYEMNRMASIYPDEGSLRWRSKHCSVCGIVA